LTKKFQHSQGIAGLSEKRNFETQEGMSGIVVIYRILFHFYPPMGKQNCCGKDRKLFVS
jgi:hypothetical protein